MKREMRLGLLFVAPWLIGFLLFTVYPVLATLYLSFTDYRVLAPPRWIGWDNYRELLADTETFWPSLFNTLYLFLELPAALILGILIALLLDRNLRGMAWYRTVFYLPSIVPVLANAMLWLWLLNPEYGLINSGLRALHLPAPAWLASPIWSKPALILMDLWAVGGSMIIYLAALQGVPSSLYEAASLDGASGFAKFVNVTLPGISPVIFFNLIMGVIGTFQYFTQTFVMTRGGPDKSTLFYALYLYQNAFQYFRMGTACAMAWLLFLLTLAATLFVFTSSARWVYYEGEK
ncbi:MAG: sugar ABC transporter permease [Capsulimonadales bacterium]|nr:sugar ABC transporter permease [Capsulimonadales bacterium]